MTIEQANQYFAALPDGFASTEQLRAAFTAPVQKVQFVGVAGTAGKTVVARLLAAILHAQGIHAGLYHAGCRPLSERICIDDAPVDEGLLALTADALSAAEALPQDAAELAAAANCFGAAGCTLAVVELPDAGLAEALLKTVAFVLLMLVVGSRVLPWVLGKIARFCPSELFQLAVVVIALGTAMAASLLFDLSVALGAFLAGVVVSGSKLSHRVAAEAIPFKDLFSIIFFASVGMMVNPVTLASHVGELIALVALIMVGKWLINMVLGVVLSAGLHGTLTVAAGLAQIGEFSFIIGQTGMGLGILTAEQYTLILGGAVVSIALNSFAFKLIDPIERWMRKHARLAALYERHVRQFEEPSSDVRDHVVVVGYGHAGRCVTEVLKNLDIPCLVVERELETAEEAEADGLCVLVGDAANSEILAHAHLDAARVLVIAGGGDAAAEAIAYEARLFAPGLHIVTRAEDEDGLKALAAAGANEVVRPELEGGIELMRHTLIDLGYTPRQIQDYANELRASGYEALGDNAQGARRRAFERLVASLSEVELEWVLVGEASAAAGSTLADLDLRAKTGVNAVALRRGGEVTLFLDARTELHKGDKVGLVGTVEQVEAAAKLFA